MAKLKTPLRIDGKRISTIEELRENFVLDEVLESYKNGVLQKWLASRGFDEAEKVEKINFKNNNNILRELIKIFEAEYDEKEINESLKTFAYMEHREERKNEYRESNEKLSDLANRNIELNGSIFSNDMINNYFLEYKTLVDKMMKENKNGIELMKIFKKILIHYNGVFSIDCENVLKKAIDDNELSIVVMFMNKDIREKFKKIKTSDSNSVYPFPRYVVDKQSKEDLTDMLDSTLYRLRNGYQEHELYEYFDNKAKNLADMLNLKYSKGNEPLIFREIDTFDEIYGEVKLKNTYMVVSSYISCEWSDIEHFKILEENETIKFKGYKRAKPLWAIEIDEEIYNTPLSLTPINTVAQKPQTTTQSFREKLLALSNATSNAINATSNAINAANNAVMKKYK